jgi:hypothetical protein
MGSCISNMQSTCTIENDTDFDIWITHGGNWDALFDSIAAASTTTTTSTIETDGAEEIDGGEAAIPRVSNVMGPRLQKSRVEIVLKYETSALADEFKISRESAERLKKEVINFENFATKIGPRDCYKWSDKCPKTTRIVYVLVETLQYDGRACTTGLFKNKNYTVSERFEFQKLDE